MHNTKQKATCFPRAEIKGMEHYSQSPRIRGAEETAELLRVLAVLKKKKKTFKKMGLGI